MKKNEKLFVKRLKKTLTYSFIFVLIFSLFIMSLMYSFNFFSSFILCGISLYHVLICQCSASVVNKVTKLHISTHSNLHESLCWCLLLGVCIAVYIVYPHSWKLFSTSLTKLKFFWGISQILWPLLERWLSEMTKNVNRGQSWDKLSLSG